MLVQNLRNLLATKPSSVVFVIGAGVTKNALLGASADPSLARLAGWGDLIRHGLQYAVDIGRLSIASRDRLASLLEDPDPSMWISAANHLSKALGAPSSGDFRTWLRNSVGAFAPALRDHPRSEALAALAELVQRGVTLATVNYDSILEEVTGLRPVTWLQYSEVQRVLDGEAGVLHLHGHWEDPASIVLGTTSYDTVVHDDHARTVLAHLHVGRTLVFVGHGDGLGDPNWGSFLDWAGRVFASHEHRHYRIAREDELPALRSHTLQAQRIALLGYPGGYENLGPFLQSLVPERPAGTSMASPAARTDAASSTPPPIPLRHVLLLVNLGERHYRFVSREDVESHSGIDHIDEVIEVPCRILTLATASAPEWRAIAADIDALVEQAEAATRNAGGKVCFVIAGAAPTPVFVYLGIQLRRITGKLFLVNRNTETGDWDRIGPFGGSADFPATKRKSFVLKKPRVLRSTSGRTELVVLCTTRGKYDPTMLHPMTVNRGSPLNGIHRIVPSKEMGHRMLEAEDLAPLTQVVFGTLSSRPTADSTILAFYGPMWAAFWVGRMLTANVAGYLEIPNFVPGAGYVPALASPMARQPWIADLPRMLVLVAEPDDETRTRGGAHVAAIQNGLSAVVKVEVRLHLHVVTAIRVDQVIDTLEEQSPHILHINAHGGQGGSLGLESARGNVHVVDPNQLVDTLRSTELRPALIVVVACHSAGLLDGLRELSDCVVLVQGPVGYRHAETFVDAFYRSLARGDSVAKAFKQGVQHTNLVLAPTDQPFAIETREGVDANAMVFWPAAQSNRA